MDNDWDSVLQLDLGYDEKVDQADEASLAMQVPTPPVSITSSFIIFFAKTSHKAIS